MMGRAAICWLVLAALAGGLQIGGCSAPARAMTLRSSVGHAQSLPPVSPSPTATPLATPGKAAGPSCSFCVQAMLSLLRADRAKYGLPPLVLQPTQSTGTKTCVGAYGHSAAMATTGALWHINARYPRASFPRDICVSSQEAAENVGESASGSPERDLQLLNSLMMSELHTRSACASGGSHACNILNPHFHTVGIGVYYANGVTWLTEDFTR